MTNEEIIKEIKDRFRIPERILKTSEKVTYILRPDPDNYRFYEQLGFEDTNSVIFKREQ